MAELKHFVRVANTDLEGKKNIAYALTKIKGVKYSFASAICNVLNLDINKKTGFLNEEEINKLNVILKKPDNIPRFMYNRKVDIETGKDRHLIGSDLKLNHEFDIKRLKKIRSYIGMRHSAGLPVRGQRTRSNFRTGSSVGVIKKKMKAATEAKK